MKQVFRLLLLIGLLAACATSPPRQVNNICRVFDQKPSWYKAAAKSKKRWESSIPLMMAFMHQESRFVSYAKPPRTKILGFIPGPRKSSAYGYSQAQDSTWKWYKKSTGHWGADRDNFQDAIDFIGWYNMQTKKKNGVSLNDAYSLYLAYHEGHGGFKKKSYHKKPWLKKVAKKVVRQASTYSKQLKTCEQRYISGGSGFSLWPF
ncbi:hypothetical protein AB835_09725 [Candidatus Endobugula sertula]|uniref:Transglycosylase SLT domain-containing protein n=1 Tax=Candidatus Endobugula sertula TaxID=62101 RepID=A0A1D2QP13_9GAMM|nr:hypothetical protein AB835_09725 [Candidatus Endobugula sertula]